MRPGKYSISICDRKFVVEVGDGPPDGQGSGQVDFHKDVIYIDKDGYYPLGTLNHEVFEAACVMLGYRYQDYDGGFLFVMDHKQMDQVIGQLSLSMRYLKRMKE
jgi:hypothetical protein